MASWGSKHNFSIIILLAVFFGSCSGEEDIPNDVLSQEKMTHVMIEIHILEAKIGRLGITTDSAKIVYDHLEKEIFAKSGTDSASFFRSFEYYSTHPEPFSVVYNAVVDSLMELESIDKLNVEAKKEALKKADSLGLNSDSLRLELEADSPRRMNIKTGIQQSKSEADSTKKPIKSEIDAKQPR